jgi:hypothetical protein
MLYIVLFGWAMIVAGLLKDVIGLVGRVPSLSAPRTVMLRTLTTVIVAVALGVFTH